MAFDSSRSWVIINSLETKRTKTSIRLSCFAFYDKRRKSTSYGNWKYMCRRSMANQSRVPPFVRKISCDRLDKRESNIPITYGPRSANITLRMYYKIEPLKSNDKIQLMCASWNFVLVTHVRLSHASRHCVCAVCFTNHSTKALFELAQKSIGGGGGEDAGGTSRTYSKLYVQWVSDREPRIRFSI